MILDAIIGLFFSIFSLLIEGVFLIFVPLLNLIAAGLELLIGLFISGFQLGRIERKKRSRHSAAVAVPVGIAILMGLGWIIAEMVILNRMVTFVAEDGHSLPFAAVIIHSKTGNQHTRTDSAGNLTVRRFGTAGITIKDPRYVEMNWSSAEIKREVIVQRTVLGSSLDSLAGKLLSPSQE